MVDEPEIAEFLAWRAFQDWWVSCDVCRERIRRRSAWAWVRDAHGDHLRACFDCLGKSVLLLPATEIGARR